MKISIAMCTYNGAPFLPEQVKSIAAQTRLPDELVVCDDRSTDETVQILEKFGSHAPFAVRVLVNSQNLGAAKNFERAIEQCTGDIIALSDQDDVWHSGKLERLEELFESQPNTGLAFTDAQLVDEYGQPAGQRLWPVIRFSPRKQQMFRMNRAFDVLLRGNVVTGATMAFRAEYKSLVLPIPENIPILHDAWIALLIAAVSNLTALPEALIDYRQHAQQYTRERDSTIKAVKETSHYQAHLHWLEEMQQRLAFYPVSKVSPRGRVSLTNHLRTIEANASHVKARLVLPQQKWRRFPGVVRQLLNGNYNRYSNGWRSAIRDMLF